ncbi:RsiV family protein [Gammaproteobacteria bacterium]|nr:RsiV family protein [Gammaproteobacteria bacterium]
MLNYALIIVIFLYSSISFATINKSIDTETNEHLNSKTIISALVKPNDETNEFYTTHNAMPSESSEYESVYINRTTKVSPKKIHEKNRQMYYTIDAIYPQINGKGLTESGKQFNNKVKEIINNEITHFKNSVQLDIPHIKTLPKEVRQNNFKIDYDIDVIHELSLVSIRFTIQGMQAGRAHPHRAHKVINYDLINNKELALKDLFKSNSQYLYALSKFSNTELNKIISEKDKWMINDGTKPYAKNFKNWNIEKGSILLTFEEYQVAPYIYGPQEIEIPYKNLKNLLSQQANIISKVKDETIYMS